MCISIIRTLFILIRSNIWEKDLSSLRRRSLLNTVSACQCRIYRYIYIDIRFTYKFLRELFNLNFKINGKNISLHDVVLDLSVCLPVLIIKVFRFQRKTLLLFYCFFFSIIIIFLTDFVQPISRKRFDRFPWNFQDW